MKKVLLTAIAAGMLALPSIASAACFKGGYVDRVTTMPGTTLNSVIYVRPSSTASVLFRVMTKDTKLVDAALTAATSRTRVMIKSNAATCPTKPTTGVRDAGALLFLVLAP